MGKLFPTLAARVLNRISPTLSCFNGPRMLLPRGLASGTECYEIFFSGKIQQGLSHEAASRTSITQEKIFNLRTDMEVTKRLIYFCTNPFKF